MKLFNEQIKKIKKRREYLDIPQQRIADIFGKTKAWWSGKEIDCTNGKNQSIEATEDQLVELNHLLEFDKNSAFSLDCDPMVFDESEILEGLFQEAKTRDFLLTKDILRYISRVQEDELLFLKSMIYHFRESSFTNSDCSPHMITIRCRDILTKSIQTKFPDEKSVYHFIDSYIEKAKEIHGKNLVEKAGKVFTSQADFDKYLSDIEVDKALNLATEAFMENVTREAQNALKLTMRQCFFWYIRQKYHTQQEN